MPGPETYRLEPSWITRRNRRVHQRVLVEVAVLLGLVAVAMTVGSPVFGLAAVLVAGLIVGEVSVMVKRRRWDSAARIDVLDAGLQFHSLAREPIELHWKDLRAHRIEAHDAGVSTVILTPESGGEDIRIEGYENLDELHERIAHALGRDA